MKTIAVIAIAAALATPAYAGDKYVVQPVQVGAENVRYTRGEATVVLEKENGSIQIQPLAFDHGSMSFSIAVLNNSGTPFNMDLSAIKVTVDGKPIDLYSRQDLERKAKNRAMWGNLAIALAGGLAAGAAASQRDHYSATTYTPRGTYRTYISTPSTAGQIQATAIAAGTGVAIAERQKQLQYTLENLAVDIVQLTTVDPGDSYGGRIVVAKTKFNAKATPHISLTVNMNGTEFPFAFRVVKPGTPALAFTAPLPATPATPANDPVAATPPALTPAVTTSADKPKR